MGVHSVLQSWASAEDNVQFSLSSSFINTLALFITLYLAFCLSQKSLFSKQQIHGTAPQLILPIDKMAESFFKKPFDFLAGGFRATSSSIFRFRLLQNEVTVVSGIAARHMFFQEKSLNLYEGFQVLIGLDPHSLNGIYKHLAAIQKPENLQSCTFSSPPNCVHEEIIYIIPVLLELLSDCHHKVSLWGKQGTLDPCSTVHDVTFQMIIRAVSSYDVAENEALVSRLKYFYDIIDSSVKPTTGPFSWVPGLAMAQKIWASMSVYRVFNKAVHERKLSGIKRNDTLQQLLDAGESLQCTLGLMMGLPIAGARSTGTIGSWLLIFLSHEQHWHSTIRKEVQALIATYSPTMTTFSGEAIFRALSAIPLLAWESKTPQLDLCIRETLRRAQPHSAVRRNTGPELTIDNHTVPSGAFILYPFADTLLNPAVYPNPLKWDPARDIRQDKFIGWGGGKHMCKGQRLATLTMKLVVAYSLMRFDLAIVDRKGDRVEPVPDWNDFLTCRPQRECMIKFSERRPGEEINV